MKYLLNFWLVEKHWAVGLYRALESELRAAEILLGLGSGPQRAHTAWCYSQTFFKGCLAICGAPPRKVRGQRRESESKSEKWIQLYLSFCLPAGLRTWISFPCQGSHRGVSSSHLAVTARKFSNFAQKSDNLSQKLWQNTDYIFFSSKYNGRSIFKADSSNLRRTYWNSDSKGEDFGNTGTILI